MPVRARTVAAAATAALMLASTAACSSEDEVAEALRSFLDGWSTGTWDGVSFVSPTGSAIPAGEVAGQIAALSGELHELPPRFEVGDISINEDLATAQVSVSWPLSGAGEPPRWEYQSTVRMAEGDGGWQLIWEPAVINPELQDGDELAVRRTAAARGEILDGDGDPLMTARDVVDVGVWESQATDLDGDLAVLDVALRSVDVEIDVTELRDRVEQAEPDQFVPVVTLRREDYDKIRDLIRDLGATTFRERVRHLAPTRTFARALLGTVDEATAEVIEENPGVYEVGDQVGYGGLSERYDVELRGTPGHAVVLSRTSPGGEVTDTELYAVEPVPGADLQITAEAAVQEAAEQALQADDRRAALVAIRVSDGAVLAAANTQGAEANPVNLAFTGAVPPGSTFKVVTAYGLLAAGEVELDTVVDCPQEATVEGRSFHNDNNFVLGEVSFLTNIARSCNTAFVSLAPRLGADGLAAAGAALGIGGGWDLGVETFTGEVSTGGGEAERAAAAFGQGTTVVSPVAMAAATAAVARGAWVPPTLVLDGQDGSPDPAPLDEQAISDLNTALREVVTSGTATALADVPGEPVSGKTGTAEAGEQTHGWFVGWQDDLAFAVFVEDGQSSGDSAVPLAERFLRGLP
jgi:cell division protein FtsI/penicillin-binding protein 2